VAHAPDPGKCSDQTFLRSYSCNKLVRLPLTAIFILVKHLRARQESTLLKVCQNWGGNLGSVLYFLYLLSLSTLTNPNLKESQALFGWVPNTRLVQKWLLAVSNALAYSAAVLVTAVKRFINWSTVLVEKLHFKITFSLKTLSGHRSLNLRKSGSLSFGRKPFDRHVFELYLGSML